MITSRVSINYDESLDRVEERDIVDGTFSSKKLKDHYIISIGKGAFEDLVSLKHIDIDLDIPDECFSGCVNLRKINIGMCEKIGDRAFSGCISLKNIFMPNVKKIGVAAFDHCKLLENVAISPEAIDNLFSYYKNNKTMWEANNIFVACKNLKRICVIPSISVMEWEKDWKSKNKMGILFDARSHYLKRIRKMFGDVDVMFIDSRKDFDRIAKEDDDKVKSDNYKKDEIDELVDNIRALCDKLPDDSKNNIISKVSVLLDNYKSDVQKSKPVYGEKQSGLILTNDKDVSLLKSNLLARLTSIYYVLTNEKKIIHDIQKYDSYKKIIGKSVTSLSNGTSLEDKIYQILYYAGFLDDDDKNKIVSCLNGYIDSALGKCNELLDVVNDISIELSLDNPSNYDMDLRVSIDGLYDEIAGKAQKIIPFRMLQRSFTSDISVNVEDEIYEFISLIKQAVNLVQDDSYKKRLKSIFNKYSLDIDNILKDDSKINDGNYQKLVLKLREELHPFLIELNSYAKANELGENMNLFEQFKVSLDLIRGKLFVEEIRNCDKLPVVSFVADIIDKLDGVDYENVQKVKMDLVRVISLSSDELSLKGSFDYFEEIQKILGKLAKIKVEVDAYCKRVIEYEKYTK